MKIIFTFLSVIFLTFLFNSSGNATGLLTEDFSYSAGTLLSANGWTAHSGAGTNAITVSTTGGATGLSYSNYAGSNVGLSVTLTTSGEDDNKLLSTPVSSGSFYAAAMINVGTAPTTGGYFFHFGTGTITFYARLFVQASGGGYNFGISKYTEAAIYESTVRTLGQTYFVVVKYTYGSPVAVYVNPTLASEPGTPTIVSSTAGDISSITAVYLRQGSSSSAPVVTVDGIMAGTTWADVTSTSGVSATFSVTGTLSFFSQTSASASAEQTYTIGGTNLTNTVTITPPSGFEISKTTSTGFVNSTSNLTFTAAQVMANPTIYVRLHAASPGSYSGDITHASSDFTTVTKSVSGTYAGACALSLTALIQARYNGSVMVPDSVTVELHDASSFGLVDHDKELLSASGTGAFTFSNAVNGSNYYIVVKHRNSIETWSASAHSFTSYALSYNFTTAATQAYGSNLILQSGKYCIYSGDVNQDGSVDSQDLGAVDNDNNNFVSGNPVTDLNGDGTTDSFDLGIVDNNNNAFISKNAPSGTPTPVLSLTGSLIAFTQTSASASAEQTYTIGGTNLTNTVTVTPPSGFEISKTTSTGFVNSTSNLTFTAAQVMANPTIYVILHAASPGSYSGDITHASSDFATVNQAASGSYIIISSNVNLTMGNPSNAITDVNYPHNYLLDKPQFCAGYDRDKGIPIWTSWQLNSTWCNGPAVRQDNYIADVTLPTGWHRVGGSDYSGSGFDRGHMCPSADRLNTQANNDALFVMTNLIPQSGVQNSGVWEQLETYERTLANAGNVLYIISGGYGSGGTGTNGYFTTISGGYVTVPAKTWKVIMVLPAGTNDLSRVTTSTRCIAVIMNNNQGPFNAWGTYRVSVDAVESLTGFDFFSNVSTSIQAVIEANVDTGPTN